MILNLPARTSPKNNYIKAGLMSAFTLNGIIVGNDYLNVPYQNTCDSETLLLINLDYG